LCHFGDESRALPTGPIHGNLQTYQRGRQRENEMATNAGIAPAEGSPNAEPIAVWNEILVPKFTRFRRTLVEGLGGHSRAVLESGFRRGEHVVDIGCGFGETSITIARRVGSRGSVLGIDCCEPFLETARLDAAKAGIENVRFVLADAQAYPFEPVFDGCFSRFGTMFFQSPVAALKNIGRALKPRGALVMLVWRSIEENEWMLVPKTIARTHLPPPPDLAPTCGPGPFSMADREMVTTMLMAAGFVEIAFEGVDAPVNLGATVDEAIAFQLQLGPAGETVRDAGAAGEAKRPIIEAELAAALSKHRTAEGVVMGSASWTVTARRP
jgi:SAM-dependent methyltransferase